MGRSKTGRRIEFQADEKVMAYLEAEQAKTGAAYAEIIRRALAKVATPTVLVASRG